MKTNNILILLLAFAFACQQSSTDTQWIANAPAGDRFAQINKNGETIIPNGRIVKPYGKTFMVAPHPYGLILSPDGQTAVTANSGTGPLSVSIIRKALSANPQIQQVPDGVRTDRDVLAAVYMGLAISPDNKELYVAGGQSNIIYVFDMESGDKLAEIDCNYQDSLVD